MEKPKPNFKELARRWNALQDGKEDLKWFDVRCPKCGEVYQRKLEDDWFICACGKICHVDKCIIVGSETEVN